MNGDSMEFAPRPSSKYWFAMVDTAVIRDATLSSTAIRIFCIICSYASRETRSWSLKIKTLADAAGCGETAVRDALKCLIARGVIEKRPQYRNGQQVASEFHIIGCDAPCYQNSADNTPCGNPNPRPTDFRTPTPRISEAPPCGNPNPVLQEPILQEPVSRDAPLPPTGDAAAAPEKPEPENTNNHVDNPAPDGDKAEAMLGKVISLWNEELGPLGFPKVSKVTPSRSRAFKARVSDLAARRDLAWWRERISQLASSSFMRNSARENANWLAFDWLLRENNLVKVTEGKYDDRRPQPVEKFSEPEAREFSQEQEDYLEAKYAGKKLDPEYWGYLEAKYGGGQS